MFSNPLVQAALWCASASLLAWVISLAKHDASIADVFWPWLGVGCGVIYLLNASLPSLIAWATLAGITMAAIRLSALVISRIVRDGEDRRYTEIRSSWGMGFGLKCLPGIFLLQGLMGFVMSLPLVVVMARSDVFRFIDTLIIGMWLVGFVIQMAADRQLAKFAEADDGTGVLRTGLWRYSRHPNYFGELCMAWSIFGLALVGGGGWTLIAPLLLTWSILRFTGVSRMEREMPVRRPEYADYANVTSALFPWPPKGDKP